MSKKNNSRRQFLNTSLSLGGGALLYSTGLLSMLTASKSFANSADDYKALVYIFLAGGNDANNMLVPMGNNQLRQRYDQHRGIVALPETDLHSLTLTKPAQIYNSDLTSEFGLHPSCSDMAEMFNNKELSLVCNVGNLLIPTTRQQFLDKSVSLPPQLFSHADQQKQYQSEPNTPFLYGWGGRLAEFVTDKNLDLGVSPLISISGLNSFQVSKNSIINPFVFNDSGITKLTGYSGIRKTLVDELFNQENQNNHLMSQKYNDTFHSMQKAQTVVSQAFDYAESSGVDYDGIFASAGATDSKIGKKLKTIAKFIAGRDSNQNKRPVFFIKMGGFDTHQNILADHQILMSELNNALKAFKDCLTAQNDFDKVLTFAGSEFGRTLTPNKTDTSAGTDHAWGGHAILMGDMVNGGQLFGTHPDFQVGQGLDSDKKRGRWIPTTPTSHVSAHIAHWFGVDKTQLPEIFPSMNNFPDPFDETANLQLFKEST